MKKIIIFGAGPTGKRAYAFYREFCDVVAYADNNEAIQETDIGGVPVVSAEQIVNMAYDYIVIASVPGYDSICQQLENYGVAQEKIKKYSSDVNNNRELSFFQYARELRDTSGACAEVGYFKEIQPKSSIRHLRIESFICLIHSADLMNGTWRRKRKRDFQRRKQGIIRIHP